MKIGAINPYSVYSNRQNPSFNGYYEVMREGAKNSIKSLHEADLLFWDLIGEIDKDSKMIKEPIFNGLKKVIINDGLKGLFETITKKPGRYLMIDDMLELLKKEDVISVVRQKGHVLDITSYGRKPHDVRIGFSAGLRKGFIEFYTNKKGDIFVDRTYGDNFVSTGFYHDTGTKKVEVEAYGSSSPERTYYNKDGTKPFFKNWFLGGPAVEAIY